MQAELTRSEGHDPLNHSVEAVLPGVHSRLAAHTNELASLRDAMLARIQSTKHR